jgi:uncharacterized membrane protein YphA (DoxX/SURF4 family)
MMEKGKVTKMRAGSERSIDREGIVMLYGRLALGAAVLSAVASRLGLYGKASSGFKSFVEYTGQVNSFMPAVTIPYLAWGATVAETALGIALIAGIWLRWTAAGAAVLLAIFGTAMAISFGIKSPMDYSVFSASAAAALLAVCAGRRAAR